MKKSVLCLVFLCLPLAAGAQHLEPPPLPPLPPAPPAPMPPMQPAAFMHVPGIPPQVAAKLGIPDETVRKVKDMAFDANEALIGLEADLQRAQLQLDRQFAAASPDEAAVMLRLEAVSKAELAVRKNRVGLMLRIRKLLGPELWQKLQTETPSLEENEEIFIQHQPGERVRRRTKIFRGGEAPRAPEAP